MYTQGKRKNGGCGAGDGHEDDERADWLIDTLPASFDIEAACMCATSYCDIQEVECWICGVAGT